MVPTLRILRAIPPAARPWLGLALSLALAGTASILLRQDSNWDLMNYHLYNAWAFVHDRHGLDWAPAQLQSFHSPFLDLPFYALVAADVPARAIAFVLAVPTGIAWYCFARIAATQVTRDFTRLLKQLAAWKDIWDAVEAMPPDRIDTLVLDKLTSAHDRMVDVQTELEGTITKVAAGITRVKRVLDETAATAGAEPAQKGRSKPSRA